MPPRLIQHAGVGPENPSRLSASRSGRSCGGSTACLSPRPASSFIFASPSSAAAFGFDALSRDFCDATFPYASPA